MNYNRFIKLYKGVFLVEIKERLDHLNQEGIIDYKLSAEEVDQIIKIKSGFDPSFSCKEMDYNDLMELSINCFAFGDLIGISLNFPNNEFQTEVE